MELLIILLIFALGVQVVLVGVAFGIYFVCKVAKKMCDGIFGSPKAKSS